MEKFERFFEPEVQCPQFPTVSVGPARLARPNGVEIDANCPVNARICPLKIFVEKLIFSLILP